MPNYINLNKREIELLELFASTQHPAFISQSYTNIKASLEIWRLNAAGYIEAKVEAKKALTVRMTEDGYKFLDDRAMVKPEPEDKHWLVEYIQWDEKCRDWNDKSHLIIASDELTAAVLFFKEHEAEIKKENIEIKKVNGDYPAHPFWIKE